MSTCGEFIFWLVWKAKPTWVSQKHLFLLFFFCQQGAIKIQGPILFCFLFCFVHLQANLTIKPSAENLQSVWLAGGDRHGCKKTTRWKEANEERSSHRSHNDSPMLTQLEEWRQFNGHIATKTAFYCAVSHSFSASSCTHTVNIQVNSEIVLTVKPNRCIRLRFSSQTRRRLWSVLQSFWLTGKFSPLCRIAMRSTSRPCHETQATGHTNPRFMLSRHTGSDNDWVIGAEQQRSLLWNRFNKHLGGANKLNHSLPGARTISRDDATVQFVQSLRPYSVQEL